MARHLDCFCNRANVTMMQTSVQVTDAETRLSALEDRSRSIASCVCIDDSSQASAAGRINSSCPTSAAHDGQEQDFLELTGEPCAFGAVFAVPDDIDAIILPKKCRSLTG